ncbi:hypothetical protein [Crocinitomix catalasitica]|uniref:hypothetical protein n=1 Tax=Crocinitomix catalasitica TaxID=184607 RepID=UPI0004823D93|nr:hypothetical protein [Crocinitomix catalasitica]
MIKLNIKKYILTLVGVLSFTSAFSQYHIKGQVLTENNELLISGNVLAYTTIDSTFIIGGLITDGKFDLYPIHHTALILKIRSFEIKDFYIDISNPNNDSLIELDKLTMQDNEVLETVEILEYIPLYEINGTTTKVNVEKTMLSESIDPIEILKRSPGIKIQDDVVSVIGRGNTLIYADGQEISVAQFKMIPVQQII